MTGQQDLVELLRSIIRDVSERPLSEIDLHTPVAELGIDSVLVAEIVVRIEDTLGIELSAAQWMSARTLQDFINLIQDARQQQA
jgi:acyl carrier protein